MQPTLYLMMGLPGSGKTTAAKAIEAVTGAVRLSSDEVRLKLWPNPSNTETEHAALYEFLDSETERLLAEGKSVIYDANLNRLVHRQQKYTLANRLGISHQLFWVKTTEELAKSRRTTETTPQLIPEGETPLEMFERIAKIIEPPKPNEPYTELDGTKITNTYVSTKLT